MLISIITGNKANAKAASIVGARTTVLTGFPSMVNRSLFYGSNRLI